MKSIRVARPIRRDWKVLYETRCKVPTSRSHLGEECLFLRKGNYKSRAQSLPLSLTPEIEFSVFRVFIVKEEETNDTEIFEDGLEKL